MPSPRPPLPRSLRRRSLILAVPEGMLYAGMVGFAEQWFVVDSIRLGATSLQQGLVVGAPLFVGALGAWLALQLMRRFKSRRKITAFFTGLQGTTLLAIASLDALGHQSPWLLVACASLYQIAGQGASPPWTSWYGDLVPERMRGDYFARRTKAVQATICAAMVAAGVLLQGLEPRLVFGAETSAWWTEWAGPGRGFALVFCLAGLSRLLSTVLLCFSPEPAYAGVATGDKVLQFLRTSRGSTAWRLIVGTGAYYAAVYLASPFFVPFMARELRFSYLLLMGAVALQIALKAALQHKFGDAIDRHGARAVWLCGVVGCALVPLPFVWTHGWAWVFGAQAASGIAWGCFEVALFVLLLQTTFRATRPHAIAAQGAMNGLGQLTGSLLGGLFLTFTDRRYRLLFVVSVALRCAATLLLPRLVRPRRGNVDTGAKELMLRVVGIVPSGGIAYEVELLPERRRVTLRRLLRKVGRKRSKKAPAKGRA
jgi:MFS family permease